MKITVVFQKKDKTITRNTFWSLFSPVCKSRVGGFSRLKTVVWCELLAFAMAAFALDLPGQLWHGLSRNNAFLSRHWHEAVSHQKCAENSMTTSSARSLLESLLFRKYLHGMAFSCILSSVLLRSLTVVAFYCLGLILDIPEKLRDSKSSSGWY